MPSIRKELAEHGMVPKKGLGQHFLVDRNILSKVIRTAQVEKGDVVLEVGPGLGEMTLALARRARKVIAVEIDPRLASILRQKAEAYPNVEVTAEDILKVDFKRFLPQNGCRVKVVANLPYQISTPLLFRFIESREVFSTLTLMLQKEVAERIIASPGGKEYSPLSIFVQSVSRPSIRFTVKPSAFFPPPKVESAVVQLVWRAKSAVEPEDEDLFKRLVRGCFSYRRKTLMNGLKYSGLPLPETLASKLEKIEIDPRRRPETLTIEEFVRLAEVLKKR